MVEALGDLPRAGHFLLLCMRHEPPHHVCPGKEEHDMRGGMHHLTYRRSVHAAGKIDEGEDRRAEPPLGASSHEEALLV